MSKFFMCKASLIFLLALATIPSPNTAKAGIPTIDVAGLVQSVLSALENVAQTLQMIEDYKNQLLQYENQLRNTINPEEWIWDEAQQTINEIRSRVDTIRHYRNTLGSLDAYLNKFKDLDYYKNNPCFTNAGCTEIQRRSLIEARSLSSESMKRANDAVLTGIDMQQESLAEDAYQLERIQASATTAVGQVQAIQFANQLASNQSSQLLQIRAILLAQQNAVTSKLQSDTDQKAQEDAAYQKLRKQIYTPSDRRDW